jgi:hypothetical protein
MMRARMSHARPAVLSLLLGVSLVAACDGDKQSAPASAPADAASKAAPDPAPIAGAPVDGPTGNPAVVAGGADPARYTLSIEPPSDVAVGQPGVVKIKVLPKDPWHMNLEYPTKLAVAAPEGVTLAKPELGKADAIALTEETCEFDVAFTATSQGEQAFSGKFKFAICQDEACSPVQEDIRFQVAVK